MTTTATAHIVLDDRGVAWIDGCNVKVIEVALDHIAHGWSPTEIHFQHPHLSLSQIHAALSYYFDHRDEFDEQIALDLAAVERMRGETPMPPIVGQLRTTDKSA